MVSRRQNRTRQQIPRSSVECNCIETYNSSLGGDTFLRYDSINDDINKVVTIIITQMLTHLSGSNIVI